MVKSLTDSLPIDSKTESIIRQVDDFERYLSEMKITVEKRQILQRREDSAPQTVCINN